MSILILCQLSSSAVSSLNNISRKCMSVLNKKTDNVAGTDWSDTPVDSLREKEVVSNKEHFYLN